MQDYKYNGQAAQDKFVLECLNYKQNGTFLEVGSNHPIHINNTYLLEKDFGWRGIMVEYDARFLPLYKQNRPGSIYLIGDATEINYAEIFESANFPAIVDYLQIDLEVDNRSTLTTLENIEKQLMTNYKFATVTYEHDIYTGDHFNTRQTSRDIFERNGYIRVASDVKHDNFPYEDWYVHPDAVDMKRVECLNGANDLEFSDVIKLFDISKN